MGNSKTIKTCRGDRKAPLTKNDHDYYATPPEEVRTLIDQLEKHQIKLNDRILEPACGDGSISRVLEQMGYLVFSYDLVDRGYGIGGKDFLKRVKPFNGDIVTNPPFSLETKFIQKSLSLLKDGHLGIFLLKLNYLSGRSRYEVYRSNPPKLILVYSYRIGCAKGGDFTRVVKGMDYCWVIFQKGYRGTTQIDWIDRGDKNGL